MLPLANDIRHTLHDEQTSREHTSQICNRMYVLTEPKE